MFGKCPLRAQVGWYEVKRRQENTGGQCIFNYHRGYCNSLLTTRVVYWAGAWTRRRRGTSHY